jgi:hypothetical protein
MPVLALALVVLSIAGGTCVILLMVWRRRTPPELRGDWWSGFEREFRAYASQAAAAERRRRRHRGERA